MRELSKVGMALQFRTQTPAFLDPSGSRRLRAMRGAGRRVAGALLACSLGMLSGCRSGLPKPQSAEYARFVQAFYVGLAAMEVGNDVRAESSFAQATQLAPGEPAAWADWGILALRQRNFEQAKQRLDRSHTLLPRNGQIDADLGALESARGNSAAAIARFPGSGSARSTQCAGAISAGAGSGTAGRAGQRGGVSAADRADP